VEQQLPAGLGERQVAELVQNDEVQAGEVIGDATLATGAGLGLELVDEVDDVEEPASGAAADAGARDGDGGVALSRWVQADRGRAPTWRLIPRRGSGSIRRACASAARPSSGGGLRLQETPPARSLPALRRRR